MNKNRSHPSPIVRWTIILGATAIFSALMLIQSYYDALPGALKTQYSETLDARCHLPHTLKPDELCACRRAAARIQKYWIQGDIQETEDCRLTVGNWAYNGGQWHYLTFIVDPLLMGGNASTGAGLWDGTPPENCQDYCPESSNLAETGICALYAQSNPLREDDPRCLAKQDPSGCVHHDKPDGTDGLVCDDFEKFAATNPDEARDRCLSDPDFQWSSECFAAEVVTWDEWKEWWKGEVCTMFANDEADGFVDPDYVYEWAGCADMAATSIPSARMEESPTPELVVDPEPSIPAPTEASLDPMTTSNPEPSEPGFSDPVWAPEVETAGSELVLPPVSSDDPLPVVPIDEPTWADPGPWVDPADGWPAAGMTDVTAGLDGKSSGLWNRVVSAVRSFFQLFQ